MSAEAGWPIINQFILMGEVAAVVGSIIALIVWLRKAVAADVVKLKQEVCKDIKGIKGQIKEVNDRTVHLQGDMGEVKERLGIAENDIKHLEKHIEP